MEQQMRDFEFRFAELMSGSTLPMDEVLSFVALGKGKRLRPKLVFLSAKLFGIVNDVTMRTALFVELLHTATLIHDDVVDESNERRGRPSVNARWDNKTAVLTGDYLLSKAMRLLADPSDHLILKEMLETTMAMSEGELLQGRRQEAEDRKQKYLDIITRKTARLMEACCIGGALSVIGPATEDKGQKMELIGEFGLNLGLVFQMRDDILDDDEPETALQAQRLLPEYLKKALEALDALKPFVKDQAAYSSLREIAVFCAERTT